MYKSYSYTNMPVPVKKQAAQKRERDEKSSEKKDIDVAKPEKKDNGLFGDLENDDILLLIVAFVLLMDGCDDKLLLAALAFIFMSDKQ